MVALGFIALSLGALAIVSGSRLAGVAALSAVAVLLWSVVRSRRSSTPPTLEETPEPAQESADQPSPAPPVRVPSTIEAGPLLKALHTEAESRALDAVAAHLWLFDPASATARVVASVGTMRPTDKPIPLDDPVIGHAARDACARLGEVARMRTHDSETTVWRFAVPLERAGDVGGVLALDVLGDSAPSTASLQEVLTPFLPNASACLAVHVARQEVADAEAVLAIAREMSRLLDPDDVISTALDKAMSLVGASTGSVMLLDEQQGVLRIARAIGLPTSAIESTLQPGEGIAGWVFATKQPLLIEDLPERPGRALRHGVKSAVCVPLADGDDVLGVLNLGTKSFLARLTESHLKTLEIIGRQTAIALRNAQVAERTRELYFQSLTALVRALETKDPHAQGGTERVLDHALAIAREMGMSGDELDAIHVAALLHDLGMIASGADLRSIDRTLTTVERGLLKAHPRIAAEILAGLPALSDAVPIVYHHHERYDGSGYLEGLAGESIPAGARVLAVADAFVAMTSDRPYRPAMTPAQALAELRDKAGTQFDPEAVAALERVLKGKQERAPERGAR
ncbi:MAG: GAF domain-containing protein [Coriobacteriia bacterium]|nr:GAF domain-containing protein [Coriobacteriia bacterium]